MNHINMQEPTRDTLKGIVKLVESHKTLVKTMEEITAREDRHTNLHDTEGLFHIVIDKFALSNKVRTTAMQEYVSLVKIIDETQIDFKLN